MGRLVLEEIPRVHFRCKEKYPIPKRNTEIQEGTKSKHVSIHRYWLYKTVVSYGS